MPTENRYSNTEQMVSVPRDEVERLVKLLKYQAHPYPSPHAEFWQGLLDAPAQHKGDPDRALKDALFACLAAGGDDREYGGVATAGDRQGWVRFTTVAAGAQHQGEPVALPARKDPTQHWAAPGEVHKAEGWNAYHDEIAKLGPLYTQADPNVRWKAVADEQVKVIDTLRADLESVKSSRDAFAQNAIDLRAQLAERDALLRDINKRHSSGVDFDLPADLAARVAAVCATSAEPKSCGACAGCTDVCQLDKDSPPSAQVEQVELVPAALMLRQAGFGNLADAVDEARAALERKP